MDNIIVSAHQTVDDNYQMSKDIRMITHETSEEVVSTHQTIDENYQMSKNVHIITQQTEARVGELHGKIDEMLKHQKSFQTALDAISGKNSLLSFLMEYLSKSKPLLS